VKYSDILSIKTQFKRSTNITYDTNCDSYILSTSPIQTLRRILVSNTSNSIAITGPFGSGKSSFLIFLESLLVKNDKSELCIEKLKEKDRVTYKQYQQFLGCSKKGFYSLKMVGEHQAFKQIFVNTLNENNELAESIQFIQNNKGYSFTSLLKQINKEVKGLGYAGLIIVVDELGKMIEYASERYLESDIHALQDLAEFVNKHEYMRLVVALHKSFKGYVLNTTNLSFTEWDKIQGRFDSIIFQDDFYELMHVFEQAIYIKPNELIDEVTNNIVSIYRDYKKHVKHKQIPINESSLAKLVPIHPFSSLALFHIFSKYFQNQRSIFSFLSAQEPFSFQQFIDKDINKNSLYTLDWLFDYINYLLNAYTVNMVDRESWILANEYLDRANILTLMQKKIIKSIALISSFGLEHLIQLDIKSFELLFFEKNEVHKEIKELESKGIILFKRGTNAYALIEETTININEEMTTIINNQVKVDYAQEINQIIKYDRILAKRFVIETGTAKFFAKKFIDTEIAKSLDLKHTLVYVSAELSEKNIIDGSSNNKNCVYIKLPLSNQLKRLIDQSIAINVLLKRKDVLLKQRVVKLLQGMLNDNKNQIDKILDFKDTLYFCGQRSQYSSELLQQKTSTILQNSYPRMPIIINDLVNPIQKETNVPIGMKQLFEHMINHEHSEKLNIEKLPPQMAIYLSVLKQSGLHQKKLGKWSFSEPNSNNFSSLWQELFKLIKSNNRISVDKLINRFCLEPFGLNDYAAKFVIFLFFIINESNLHFFRERTYQFDFDIDQLMDIWKNSQLYEVEWYELTANEEMIFTKYLNIFDQFIDTNYSKRNIKTIFQKLFVKLNSLPKFCHQTKLLSMQAISLRSSIFISKDPHTVFFKVFPKALGYKQLDESNIDNFISEFKQTFNEIVFIYKKMLQEIEGIVVEAFELSNRHYPFDNQLEDIFKKYLEGNDDKDVIAVSRICKTSIDLRSFLNGLSSILSHKKIDNAFDHDITELKKLIYKFSSQVLTKIDIVELINNRPVDVKKLKISTIKGDNHLVMMVEKGKILSLGKKASEILKTIEGNYTPDEQLYLITSMAEKAIKGNNAEN